MSFLYFLAFHGQLRHVGREAFLAHSFSIKGSVFMRATRCQRTIANTMVAFVTHALRVVLLVCVRAFCDCFSSPPHFATICLALNHYRALTQLGAFIFLTVLRITFFFLSKGLNGTIMFIRT